MRIRLSQSDFLGVLQTVIDAVPARGTLPVLSTILVTAEGEACTLSATDLEVSITTVHPVTVEAEGTATFPARKMFEIVRELPDCELTLEADEGRVTLTTPNGRYSMLGMPPGEFPTIPTKLDGVDLVVDGELLRRMVSKVAFAVYPDPTRPTLNGVNWRVSRDSMIMIATDAHRLAKITETVDGPEDGNVEVIVPPRVLQNAVKLTREDNPLEKVTLGERQVHFAYAKADLFARLIEGSYADVDAVIPRDNDKEVVVESESFVPAVRRMQILANQQTHQVRLELKESELELTTLNRETGADAKESLEVEYADEAMEVGYNANYLQEVLAKIDSDRVRIKLRDATSGAIVEPAEQVDGEQYFCLLMPLRLIDG